VVGVGDGVAFLTSTPLFHTNFFPDLMQVYLIPAEVLVWPTFLHAVPGFGAAVAIGCSNPKVRVTVSKTRNLFRIGKLWWPLEKITRIE
jgi:hypothetical protein